MAARRRWMRSARPKASASCGSCTGLVESLLAITLGDDYAGERAEKTLCKCTSFTHEDVRRLIVEKQLKAIPEVMQELHWTTPDGCYSCRPARSEEHTSELQSLMRISYASFCLKNKKYTITT